MNHNGFRDFHIGGDSVYLEADLIDRRIAPFSNEYNYANQNPFKYIDPWGLYPALQVTLPSGFTYMPLTVVKGQAQSAAYGAPVNSTVPIAVPPGINPQTAVNAWAGTGIGSNNSFSPVSYPVFYLYWKLPFNDYKNWFQPRGFYDAFGNFQYGATRGGRFL
jgi:hypothetical protein